MAISNNDYYNELSKSIKSIFDLTTRIDERVKSLIKKEELLQPKCEQRSKEITDTINKVTTLESAQKELHIDIDILKTETHKMELLLQAVKIQTAGHENKWKTIMSFSVQLIWAVLACYLLMKLGFETPPIP